MASASEVKSRGHQRRSQVIQGAVEVIAERGIESMSHRLIAQAAGVPVAATTYYFESLDDLRAAALDDVVAKDLAVLERRLSGVSDVKEAADAIADIVYADLQRRQPAVMQIELFASATRREPVRKVMARWGLAWTECLVPLVGEVGAIAVLAATAGLMVHAVTIRPLSREEILAVLDRAMGTPDRPSGTPAAIDGSVQSEG